MARSMIDQLHLSFYVPPKFSAQESRATLRTLFSPGLQRQLKNAVRAVLRRHASLAQVRIALSR